MEKFTQTPLVALLSVVFSFAASPAQASCGSSFCSVNTHWSTQGLDNAEGLSLDLRYSRAKADRLRAGSTRITAEEASGSGEELENRHTLNEMVDLVADYAFTPRWSLALTVPYVMREHTHTLDSSAGTTEQTAKFKELGDLRLVGKYNFDTGRHDLGGGVRLGVKLPTGETKQTMSPPDPADPDVPYLLERSAQPGSGSADVIVGAFAFGSWIGTGWGWFGNVEGQIAVASRDNYRPGDQVNVDAGVNYNLTHDLVALLQLNYQHRERDTGLNANPASGGYSVNLSPGLTYALTPQTRIYGFVQKALKQYANTDPADPASGQLTAPWSLAMGINHHF
uniref:Uncharacterized protein n=1 Tax=uncultured prokaryote AT3 TaxID=672202 RepID=D3W8G4_9ZZZZ|nr:conserved hypothetical protein [uncultured prokaryote AT3]